MGKHGSLSGSGGELSAGEMVGGVDGHAAELRGELRRESGCGQVARIGRARTGEHPPHHWHQSLMRAWLLLIVAAGAGLLTGCQTGTPTGRTASNTVPQLEENAATAAGV